MCPVHSFYFEGTGGGLGQSFMVNPLTMAEMILGVLLLEAITRDDQQRKLLLRLLMLYLQNVTGGVCLCIAHQSLSVYLLLFRGSV